MANGQRGEVELKIGGKVRTMKFGFNEMAALEQRLEGRSVIRMMSEGNFGIWAMREALFVGLRPYYPNVTSEKIGLWLESDMANIGYYASKVGECIASFMPAKKEASDEDAEVSGPLDPEAKTTTET